LLEPRDALVMLSPDALARAISAVEDTLLTEYFDNGVRSKAINTLHNLKQMRARLHWATARVYRVRWYARCWYEDVLVKLCAPGGKWAALDRAAFEKEFM